MYSLEKRKFTNILEHMIANDNDYLRMIKYYVHLNELLKWEQMVNYMPDFLDELQEWAATKRYN